MEISHCVRILRWRIWFRATLGQFVSRALLASVLGILFSPLVGVITFLYSNLGESLSVEGLKLVKEIEKSLKTDDGLTAQEISIESGNYKVVDAKPGVFAVKVAQAARAKVGILSNTRANELVYQRVCLDVMRDLNVRYTDIDRHIGMAMLACFINNETNTVALDAIKALRDQEGFTH